jgi:hypothetical protein
MRLRGAARPWVNGRETAVSAALGLPLGLCFAIFANPKLPHILEVPACLVLLLAAFAFGWTRYRTARRTRKAGSGAGWGVLVGIVAGFCGGATFYIVEVIARALPLTIITMAGSFAGITSDMILFAAVGAACGAIGAQIGLQELRSERAYHTRIPAPHAADRPEG